MAKILPPQSRNNGGYHEVAWGNSDMTFKKYMIYKAVKEIIPETMQKYVK